MPLMNELTSSARFSLDWAATQNNLGTALRDLVQRTRDTSELCKALGGHVSAWQVFSGVAPYQASISANGAKTDVDAIHIQSPGSAPKCLQTYSAELKQMGVANAAAPGPLS
jgi:hypothetical protein